MRKLVTIRTIGELRPIEGADAIECAIIDGWTVVVKKGEFAVGDPCIYFEIDSFLPESDSRYAFLMKSGVREFEGARGHRLRTVKLRGQLSQGLALPLQREYPGGLPYGVGVVTSATGDERFVNVGDEVTEELGIKKWEMPIPAHLAGQVKGDFPSFIRKTDQERAQNIAADIFAQPDAEYEITTKLDGTSFTAYFNNGEVGVCSRNLELKVNEENKDNTLVRMLVESGLQHALTVHGKNLAVQGELMGPGIQKNREGLKEFTLFVFDFYDIDQGKYLTPYERHNLIMVLDALAQQVGKGISHVPLVQVSKLSEVADGLSSLLTFAEGPSLNHPVREGVVFKRLDGQFSFKVISNAFLLKEKE